jgi:hypothetical protein
MLDDGKQAVLSCGLWDWLLAYSPHPTEGFLYATDMELVVIRSAMKHPHTLYSFADTMRTLHSIARCSTPTTN